MKTGGDYIKLFSWCETILGWAFEEKGAKWLFFETSCEIFTLGSGMDAGRAWCLVLTSACCQPDLFLIKAGDPPKKTNEKKSQLIKWAIVFGGWVCVCVQKSATSCIENKRRLCPLRLTLPGRTTTQTA